VTCAYGTVHHEMSRCNAPPRNSNIRELHDLLRKFLCHPEWCARWLYSGCTRRLIPFKTCRSPSDNKDLIMHIVHPILKTSNPRSSEFLSSFSHVAKYRLKSYDAYPSLASPSHHPFKERRWQYHDRLVVTQSNSRCLSNHLYWRHSPRNMSIKHTPL